MARPQVQKLKRRNRVTVLALLGLLAGMGGLTAAAVPLYQMFCQVTGYGGTTQAAAEAPAAVAERTITVRFNADVGRDMPWTFKPAQREVTLRVGETAMAYYTAENNSDAIIVGSAVFNVTPHKAGRYFSKIACFCFDEQLLGPGELAEMPVTFFVDPAIMADANLDDVTTITLSYTFFRHSDAPEPVADSGAAMGATTQAVN